ncbi:MAG TPA: hypothetical protein VHH35_12125 [Pyrinomonadaceae bacterium]|nr:hypothetical protein [Pyrinomonadaceae bacterium]
MATIGRLGIALGLVLGLAAAFWIITPNMPHVLAQSTTTGEWKASLNKDKSKIQLNLERRTQRGGRNQMGQSYDFAELQGLSREQALSGGPVRFSLVREAGRIDCEGSFQDGKGSGTFTFTPNPAFISAMKSRGFDFEADSKRRHDDDDGDRDDRLFAATALNVTTALADDLTAAFGKLDINDLFKAAIFKVDSQFAREMKASGFENLGMEELVKARIFKVDAAFVKQVSDMGFQKEPFESLVKMQIFKVTPEFIAEVRNEGFTNIQVEDIVKFRIFKIDGQFIREAKADGVPLEVERLVQRKIGVSRR